MGRLGFAGDDADLDVLETGVLQKLVQIRLAKAQPAVGVKFAGFFKLMLEQVENGDAPAFF